MLTRRPRKTSKLTRLPSALVFISCALLSGAALADMGQAYRDAEQLNKSVKSKRSATALNEIKASLKVALKNLQEAYDKNNAIRINCVKGHLATTKGLLRIAEEAEVSLKEAIVTDQVDIINHEFVKIMMAQEQAKRAQSLLLGCSGDLKDPMRAASQQNSKPEVFDKQVENYTASSDDSSVLVYEPIASERPEAISLSE